MKIRNISSLLIFALLTVNSQLLLAIAKPNSLNEKIEPKTKVMVLANYHLSQEKEFIAADELTDVLKKLEQFSPDAIAIEALPPKDIVNGLRDDYYKNQIIPAFVGELFIELGKAQQARLKIDEFEAMKQFDQAVLDKQKNLQIFQLAVASYNKYNALMYWIRLDDKERNTLPAEQNSYFDQLSGKNNENLQIATYLANRLELSRLYSIDNHQDKSMMTLLPTLPKVLGSHPSTKQLMSSDYMTKTQEQIRTARESKDWMPVFLRMNSESYQQQVITDEWALFTQEGLPQKETMARLAMWDVRNLHMISNIMEVVANNPGKKILVTVGASHKIFFDTLLSEMMGVEVVHFR